jgi:hypothetical protein
MQEKKNTIYTVRMSRRVREALRKAAFKERRTVASLLDKIVADYLLKEGFLKDPELSTERRASPRKKLAIPAKTVLENETFRGVILNMSMGGVLITYAKASGIKVRSVGELIPFEVCLDIPKEKTEICLDCQARHMRDTGSEIEIGAAFINAERDRLQKLSTTYLA